MRALFRYLAGAGGLVGDLADRIAGARRISAAASSGRAGLFREALTTGAFWQHAGASAWRVLSAMSLAWLVAFPLGLILGHVRSVDNTLSPDGLLTYPLPKIVLLPCS